MALSQVLKLAFKPMECCSMADAKTKMYESV